jgi:hypothetical protein
MITPMGFNRDRLAPFTAQFTTPNAAGWERESAAFVAAINGQGPPVATG